MISLYLSRCTSPCPGPGHTSAESAGPEAPQCALPCLNGGEKEGEGRREGERWRGKKEGETKESVSIFLDLPKWQRIK